MKDIVICYAKEDKKQARQLISRLETNSIKCWISPRDETPGANHEEEITKAIQGAEILILILSSSSEKSQQTAKELEIAAENKIPIIPFKTGRVSNSMPVQYMLSTLDWVDAHEESFDDAYEILLEIIEEITEGRTTAQNPEDRKIIRTSEQKSKEKESKKNSCLVPVIVGVLVLAGLLFFFKNEETANNTVDNISTNTNNVNNLPSKNDIVPTEHNITEKVASVEGRPIVGVWRIDSYNDSRKVSAADRATINTNIEALKKVALVIFREDQTFMRAGFTPQPQEGSWEIDSENKKVFLIPKGTQRKETMNLTSLTDSLMKMVVVEPQKDAVTGRVENVTTQINFKKQ